MRPAGLLVVIVMWLTLVIAQDPPIGRVHYIDRSPPSVHPAHYLFRGESPVDDNTFEFRYQDLVTSLRMSAQQEQNLTLPTKFVLVDISLLALVHIDPWPDLQELESEFKFFQSNSSLGQLWSWECHGDDGNASVIDSGLRDHLVQTLQQWQADNLPMKMHVLREAMLRTYSDGLSRVFYIHCDGGVDRTGELSGAYYLRWLGWSYDQALALDYQIAGRPLGQGNQLALQWYCYYLKEIEHFDDLDCSIWKPTKGEW